MAFTPQSMDPQHFTTSLPLRLPTCPHVGISPFSYVSLAGLARFVEPCPSFPMRCFLFFRRVCSPGPFAVHIFIRPFHVHPLLRSLDPSSAGNIYIPSPPLHCRLLSRLLLFPDRLSLASVAPPLPFSFAVPLHASPWSLSNFLLLFLTGLDDARRTPFLVSRTSPTASTPLHVAPASSG